MTYSSTALGWDEGWAAALAALQDPALVAARVMAVHRGRVAVCGDDLDALLPVAGALSSGARSARELPAVGDWVAVGDGAVRAVLPRRSFIARADDAGAEEALVANADLAAIVTSLDQDANVARIERFVALARAGGVEPLLVASKGDLARDPIDEADALARAAGGVDVVVLSTVAGWGLPALRARMAGSGAPTTTALLGMSGVGKSTLVNALLEDEVQRTLPVRERDDRGRHATTHRELFVLEDGALLVDAPGMRLPRLAEAGGLDEAFADVGALAERCRFGDCRHDGEPGCAVAEAIASGELDARRLEHLRKLEREGLSAQERRERHRAFARMHRKDVAARTRHR